MGEAEGTGGGRLEAWEVLSSEEAGEYPMFRVRRECVRMPKDGSVREWGIAESPDGVAVVALTADGGVVLVEQWRVPLRGASLELPSGVVDDGEDPADAALRELREETGFAAEDVRVVGCLELNPSWQTTKVYVAVARGAARAGEQDEDPGEDIRVRVVPLEEARRMAADGRIRAAAAVAALAVAAWAEEGG